MLQQMYNHEFTKCQHLLNKDVVDMSQEELKFIEILKNGIELVGGHFQVPLPFRKYEVNLPNKTIIYKLRRDLPAWRENRQEILNSNKIT